MKVGNIFLIEASGNGMNGFIGSPNPRLTDVLVFAFLVWSGWVLHGLWRVACGAWLVAHGSPSMLLAVLTVRTAISYLLHQQKTTITEMADFRKNRSSASPPTGSPTVLTVKTAISYSVHQQIFTLAILAVFRKNHLTDHHQPDR